MTHIRIEGDAETVIDALKTIMEGVTEGEPKKDGLDFGDVIKVFKQEQIDKSTCRRFSRHAWTNGRYIRACIWVRPYIEEYDNDHSIAIPWMPMPEDLYADDWYEVDV